MMRLALLAAMQAFAIFAGWLFLAPVAGLGAVALSLRPAGFRRVRTAAVFFAAMLVAITLLSKLERAMIGPPASDAGGAAILALRGFASFLAALTATRMFTLVEILSVLRRMRTPEYVLTMTYLVVHDFGVMGRLAADMSRAIRSRGAGVRGLRRIRLMARASGNFLIMTTEKFRRRHEYIQARGLDSALPIESWRERERLRQG